MKKNSKTLRKDYSKCSYDRRAYYGVFLKNDRVHIDTKRYEKTMGYKLSADVRKRNSVYYTPSKIGRYDYLINNFKDELRDLKMLWEREFSKAINVIKTPKQVEDDARLANLADGIYDYEEANTVALFARFKREQPYKYVIKSIYAQFYHQMMSQIDALCLRVCISQGYKEDDFSKKSFDVFIQGKQKAPAKSFKDFEYYYIFDKAYLVWNFLKHNSKRSYDELKRKFPEMIYDPNNRYENGNSALPFVKIDECFIVYLLDNLGKFFGEVCHLAFGENIEHSDWDYDDYFLEEVDEQIEDMINPLCLSPWI